MSQQASSFDELQRYLSSPPYPFKAILLATREDEVMKYVVTYPDEIDAMTGKVCRLLYFKDKDAQSIFKSLDPVQSSRGAAYGIASALGIPMEKMPCLVVFEDLSDDVADLAVLALPKGGKDNDGEITSSLREFVTFMDRCRDRADGQRLSCFKGKVRNRLIVTRVKGLLGDVVKDVLSSGIGAVIKLI